LLGEEKGEKFDQKKTLLAGKIGEDWGKSFLKFVRRAARI